MRSGPCSERMYCSLMHWSAPRSNIRVLIITAGLAILAECVKIEASLVLDTGKSVDVRMSPGIQRNVTRQVRTAPIWGRIAAGRCDTQRCKTLCLRWIVPIVETIRVEGHRQHLDLTLRCTGFRVAKVAEYCRRNDRRECSDDRYDDEQLHQRERTPVT